MGGIERGSPAEKGGIRLGDVIVRVGDQAVADLTGALNAIADVPPGMTVAVTVLRADGEVPLKVTVGKRRPGAAAEPPG